MLTATSVTKNGDSPCTFLHFLFSLNLPASPEFLVLCSWFLVDGIDF